MELNVINEQGQETAKVAASDAVFGREYNEALIHQIVVAYMANARQGTRAQLTRAEVHHSTKKPFKQKGTGRARAGMTSSPLWRKGGRAFPNLPEENFSQKINNLASRNLKNVSVVTPRYADPLSLIHYKKVVVEKAAVAKLEEMLG